MEPCWDRGAGRSVGMRRRQRHWRSSAPRQPTCPISGGLGSWAPQTSRVGDETMGPTDGGEVGPRSLGLQERGGTSTVEGRVEAGMLGGREGGYERARKTTSRQASSGVVVNAGHHRARRSLSSDNRRQGVWGWGGVSGMVPRSLAPGTPLRGPRAAVGWLFELACPAVHPPR